MAAWHELLIKKLTQHSDLSREDTGAIRALPDTLRMIKPDEDIVKQGDKPKVSAVVVRGTVARYHTLQGGKRQYISLHIAGDMPDSQTLFLDYMDHAVCALGEAVVALLPHTALLKVFKESPSFAFAVWRETLVDAAVFREAITNNSARPLRTRLAHFLCEQYYRAHAVGLAQSGSCSLPLTQTQLGETVGASLPSITRALQSLRGTRAVELRGGQLRIRDWRKMVRLGDFSPNYLHLGKQTVESAT